MLKMAILLNGMEQRRAYGHHTKCLNTQQFVRLVMIETVKLIMSQIIIKLQIKS